MFMVFVDHDIGVIGPHHHLLIRNIGQFERHPIEIGFMFLIPNDFLKLFVGHESMVDATGPSHAGIDLFIKLLHQLLVILLHPLHNRTDVRLQQVDILPAFLIF